MKITVITTTYNSAATIGRTLASILSQTHHDTECIVVDGKSSDDTMSIVHAFETRFAGRLHYISEPDKGIYDAMNKGINMASGDIIGILNSDDFFYDNYVLADITQTFETNDIEAVYGNLVFIDRFNTNQVLRVWHGSQYTTNAFLRTWHPAHPTFYVRRECYERYGNYNTDIGISADFDLMLRFLEVKGIKNIYLDRYFVKMRLGGASTGSLRAIIRANFAILHTFKRYGLKPPYWYLPKRASQKAYTIIKGRIKALFHKI